MDTSPATPIILSLPRMARRLGVSQRWLRQQADAGVIPALVAGGRYLFAPLAVEAAVARLASGEAAR